jgi:UDP-N-acetyl-D-glucosamine dehydrogenase
MTTADIDSEATAVGGHDDSALPTSSTFAFDVGIIGLGYVGLPTALAFHAAGLRVLAVDINAERLGSIEGRDVDLLDVDLRRLSLALEDPSAFVLSDAPSRLDEAATVIVCVPTPVDRYLAPDLTALRGACATVVRYARPGQTLLLTSTTYVGCTRDLLVEPLIGRGLRPGHEVFVAFAPERIDPGNSRHPAHEVPRVVGGVTPACLDHACEVLARGASEIHRVSSPEAAELTKLYENTFRAVNISLANEFADISRALRLDIAEVIRAAATKPYGFLPFWPGPGVGGHCIPCDPHYLLWQLREQRVAAPMIETAMGLVARRPGQVVHRAAEILAQHGKTLAGSSILLVGVAYKPGVTDVRESPALEIIERLSEGGAMVAYTDELVPAIRVAAGDMKAVVEAGHSDWDLIVVHTVHPTTRTAWLAQHPAVLDATYRLTDLPQRWTL